MAHEDRYYARSWALLTRDKGWIKPLLVMASAVLAATMAFMALTMLCLGGIVQTGSNAPIALAAYLLLLPILLLPVMLVSLAVNGYALEWARLTAWEVDAAPKQKGIQIGACIKAGWRGFVATIGYQIAFAILSGTVTALFARTPLSGLVSLAMSLVSVFLAVVYLVISLRATIYQRFAAGYKVNRIWEMVSRDPVGLLKITGILLLVGLVGFVVIFVIMLFALVPALMPVMLVATRGGSTVATLSNAVGTMMVSVVVAVFPSALLAAFMTLIGYTAVALWMRQFHVPLWGGSDDPLPTPGGLPPVDAAPDVTSEPSWAPGTVDAPPYGTYGASPSTPGPVADTSMTSHVPQPQATPFGAPQDASETSATSPQGMSITPVAPQQTHVDAPFASPDPAKPVATPVPAPTATPAPMLAQPATEVAPTAAPNIESAPNATDDAPASDHDHPTGL